MEAAGLPEHLVTIYNTIALFLQSKKQLYLNMGAVDSPQRCLTT